MKVTRKLFGTLLILTLVGTVLLAGCGRADKPTVSFMVFGGPEELAAYQSLVDAFHAAQSDVQVELRYVPDQAEYRRRLAADFSAGAAADVMLLNYRRFATFAGQGGLEPLSSYLDQSTVLEEGDFYTPVIDSFRFNGQLWCIPQNMSSLVVYYNQNLFDAAGLPYPSDDWTWGEFLAAAQRLTVDLDGDGQPDQYGVGIEPTLNRLAPFIWQAGGELVDDPQNPTRLALDSPPSTALCPTPWRPAPRVAKAAFSTGRWPCISTAGAAFRPTGRSRISPGTSRPCRAAPKQPASCTATATVWPPAARKRRPPGNSSNTPTPSPARNWWRKPGAQCPHCTPWPSRPFSWSLA